MKESKRGANVGKPEVPGLRRQDPVRLQDAVGDLGQVADAPKMFVIHVEHASFADAHADIRHASETAALAVVGTIRQTGKHGATPGGADHQIGRARHPHAVRVAKCVHTSKTEA